MFEQNLIFYIYQYNMIAYILGDTTEQDLFLTLHENQTTSEPIYNFRFVHVLTKTEVLFTKTTTDDKSFWPERYNNFKIRPGELFSEPGEWHFFVIEQQTGVVLEQGILMMNEPIVFSYKSYNGNTRYKAYRG